MKLTDRHALALALQQAHAKFGPAWLPMADHVLAEVGDAPALNPRELELTIRLRRPTPETFHWELDVPQENIHLEGRPNEIDDLRRIVDQAVHLVTENIKTLLRAKYFPP